MDAMDKHFVGIDIGSSTIKMLIIGKSGGRFSKIDSYNSDCEDGVIDGFIDNYQRVGNALERIKQMAKDENSLIINDAYFGFSSEYTRGCFVTEEVDVLDKTANHYVSEVDVKNLQEKIKAIPAPENEVIVDRILINYVLDNKKVTGDPKGYSTSRLGAEYLFVLSDKTQWERVHQAANIAHIHISGIVVNSTIQHKGITTPLECADGVAVINLGHGTTDISVVHDKSLKFIMTLPIGINSILKDFESLGIPKNQCEIKLHEQGKALASLAPEDGTVDCGVRTKIACKNLAIASEQRLREIISYIQYEIKKAQVSSCITSYVVTGGGAHLDGIDTLFEECIEKPCRIAEGSNMVDDVTRIEAIAHSIALYGSERGANNVPVKPAAAAPKQEETIKVPPRIQQQEPAEPVKKKEGKKASETVKTPKVSFWRQLSDKITNAIMSDSKNDYEI